MNPTVAIIAGFLLPFVVSFLKDRTWSQNVKQLVAFGASAVVAVGVTAIDEGTDLSNWDAFVANLGVIFATAQVWYGQYFGGTSVNTYLESKGVGSGGSDYYDV